MVWAGGAFVVRGVAGVALGREPLKLPCGSAFVASLTINRRVRTDEREAILMVTNRGYGNLPAFDGVTGFTIRAELATVDIGMAIRALLSDIRENEFHMALGALHIFVHAAQRVAGLVVVKFRNTADGLPTEGSVAVFAGNVECAVRIARNRCWRRSLRPLSEGLEGSQEDQYPYPFSTEHGTTSFGGSTPSIRF